MADFLIKPPRRTVKEIPLAPILDLLTVVIFFLILSTSFEEVRQNTIPQSQLIKPDSADTAKPEIPLNPKVLLAESQNSYKIVVTWTGDHPGSLSKNVAKDNQDYNKNLYQMTQELLDQYIQKFPNEKTIQIGFESKISFQNVITIYDAVYSKLKDIVLLSNVDSDAILSSR